MKEESKDELVELTRDRTLGSELTQTEEEKNDRQEPSAEMEDKMFLAWKGTIKD